MGMQGNTQQFIFTDIPKDLSSAFFMILPVATLVGAFILHLLIMMVEIMMKTIIYGPDSGTLHHVNTEWTIVVYIIFYLCCIAMVLQDRNKIELTHDTITINRFLFDNVVLKKKDNLD